MVCCGKAVTGTPTPAPVFRTRVATARGWVVQEWLSDAERVGFVERSASGVVHVETDPGVWVPTTKRAEPVPVKKVARKR